MTCRRVLGKIGKRIKCNLEFLFIMMMLRASDIARAYPVSDVRRPRLTSVRNGQGLPGFGRSRRNGVGIVLSKEIKDSFVSVSRTNDRVMSVKLGIGETVVNVICAYAPQVGCEDEEKETFWRQMDQELRAIPEGERVIVRGDLNGHVGISREAIERIHGGWGVGEKNEEGERVTDVAMAFDLSIVNTFFEKRPNHLVTYKSGGRQSQIKVKVWFYIALYPVHRTAQNALHFPP